MKTFVTKPWNDPWTRAAERDPSGGYKAYCYGTRAAREASWHRLSKAIEKFDNGRTPSGRIERAVLRALRSRVE